MKNLEKLFESELLSAESKKEIKEAFDAAEKSIREELEVAFAKKLVEDKQQLNIKLVSVIDEAVNNEISELREDIVNARTLEIRYAKKLEDFKNDYTGKMNEAMSNVINAYVVKEFNELRQDLAEAKKQTVLTRVFEAFADEFRKLGLTPSERELSGALTEATEELAAKDIELKTATRAAKLEGLLVNLTGGKREVMRTILENVEAEKLESRYNSALAEVLKEETIAPAGTKVLTEGAKTAPAGRAVLVNESATVKGGVSAERSRLRKLAGLED